VFGAGSGDVARLDPLARQLRCLRLYALLTYPFACVPFLFLYFHDHGIDAGRYGEIVGAYYLAMFVAEVPTGVLADRFGPKVMLCTGPLLLAAGFATLLLAPTYGGFLAGEVLLGIGHAVLSGPPAVLLYESLHAHGQQHRFLREESRLSALRLLGTGSSFLIGGALAQFGNASGDAWAAAIVATALLDVAAAVVAVRLLPGPPRAILRWRTLASQVGTELRKPAVAWLLGYWIVLFALLRFPFHDYQPWLREAGQQVPVLLDPLFVGVLFAALNLAAAPLSAWVPRLVDRFGRRALFWGMPLVLCASMLLMAWERDRAAGGTGTDALVWLGLSMFFVQQVPFGMHWALLQEFVNHRIGPGTRTTVLSVLSLGARAVYAVVNVALFHLQAARGIAAALLAAGAAGAVATVLVMWARPRGLLRGSGPVA
jgi:predicted MFS family arabinose efflux permease